ncbi:profilin [Microbotryum lychnidis-dioicae p1A1 Lamole]|uniref:Profilin n=2 Tax=Microbotryum TaxID=34416 RepID=U5HI45_USTV1|nr:profilin [Microbotryum lychnidis-dioicae p1A1 Lamole]SGY41768.1 BQ5605_C003g02551 [Microbotryum silenes-dioicae]|eukprot:KDE02766.1 profilin [Microbotryum lychnidis-dioicae p1A1 Lamole]
MSWQVYCDSNLIGTGKITRCAILGQQGGVWASSTGYELTSDEQANIVKAFSDPSSAQANGIRAAGNKFFTLAANDRSIYGKKAADGIILVKTNQAVLVAEYSHPTLPGEATKIVEELADYLIGVGF